MIRGAQQSYTPVGYQLDAYEATTPTSGCLIETESHTQVHEVNWESTKLVQVESFSDSLSPIEPKEPVSPQLNESSVQSIILNNIRTASNLIYQYMATNEKDEANNSLLQLNQLAKFIENQVNLINSASYPVQDPFMFPPCSRREIPHCTNPNQCFQEEYPVPEATSPPIVKLVNSPRPTNSQKEKKREQRLKRVVKKLKLNPSLHCQQCGTKNTPEWRKGPNGRNTLCNACGIKYSKEKRQKRDLAHQ